MANTPDCTSDGSVFDTKFPESRPVAIGSMSREEIDAELLKGIKSLDTGKTYTVDEIDEELKKEFKK